MSDGQAILLAGGAALAAWLLVAVAHIGSLCLAQGARRHDVLSAAVFVGGGVVGAIGVWVVASSVPAPLRLGAVCLYVAGLVGYVELRSLLSRGYSLRMLRELRGQEAGWSVAQLQERYAGGRGLPGLLRRRLESIERLGLLTQQADRVGPLTPLGRVGTRLAAGWRGLLRMDGVG